MNNIDPLSLWIVAGLILLISEMLTGGFFLIFIAIGCFAAALASTVGATIWIEALVCAVIAVVGVIALRKPIQARMMKTMKIEADLGKTFRASDAIDLHEKRSLSYQGVPWSAINVGLEPVLKGDHVTIVGMDGNVLLIRKET